MGPGGMARAVEMARTHILAWLTGPLVKDRGPNLLNPLPYPLEIRLEYAGGPAGARIESFHPAARCLDFTSVVRPQ